MFAVPSSSVPHHAIGRIRPSQSLSSANDLVPPSGFHSRSSACSFSVDLLQVILGLPRCLFPSSVQNRPSLAMSLGSFLSMCPIHVHFLRVKLTMMSSWLQILRTFKFVTFCGHLMPSIMRRHLWVKTLSYFLRCFPGFGGVKKHSLNI